MSEATTRRRAIRIGDERAEEAAEHVAVEEPLSIQLDCQPLAVTMRSPGHDAELALGFLFAEGIVESREQVARVIVSNGQGDEQLANVMPTPDAAPELIERLRASSVRRGTLTTSACGVCGRERIDDLVARCRPLDDGPAVDPDVLVRLTGRLAEEQGVFERTGGVHAAAVFDTEGRLQVCREDVGRHNAVDKVVGALLEAGRLPMSSNGGWSGELAAMAVSGRASFEIVQKAVMARIPIVVSVSAASSLAIDLAEACRLTLVGFTRAGGGEVYAGLERVGRR